MTAATELSELWGGAAYPALAQLKSLSLSLVVVPQAWTRQHFPSGLEAGLLSVLPNSRRVLPSDTKL